MDITVLLAGATDDLAYRHMSMGECLECKLKRASYDGDTVDVPRIPFLGACGKAVVVGDADGKEKCPECVSAETDALAYELANPGVSPIENCGFCGLEYTIDADVARFRALLDANDERAFRLLMSNAG